MPFDNLPGTVNHGCMAGAQLRRNTKRPLDRHHAVCLDDLDVKPELAHMVRPARTAAAVWILVHCDGGFAPVSQRQHCRSEEHTSELQSRGHLVCRLLLEKKKN